MGGVRGEGGYFCMGRMAHGTNDDAYEQREGSREAVSLVGSRIAVSRRPGGTGAEKKVDGEKGENPAERQEARRGEGGRKKK